MNNDWENSEWELEECNEERISFRRKNEVGGGAAGFALLFIIYIIYQFISNYWAYILAISATVIVAMFLLFFIKPLIGKAIVVLLAIGLIIGVINYESINIYRSKNNRYSSSTKYMKATVNASVLNVRSGPSTSYPVVGTLSAQSVIYIDHVDDGWAKIHLNGRNAYVSSKYLIYE